MKIYNQYTNDKTMHQKWCAGISLLGLGIFAAAWLWAKRIGAIMLVLAVVGCSTYREHIVSTSPTIKIETTRTATVLGTGNRRDILGRDGIDSTHSQIPETITTIGAAAGEAAKAAVIP